MNETTSIAISIINVLKNDGALTFQDLHKKSLGRSIEFHGVNPNVKKAVVVLTKEKIIKQSLNRDEVEIVLEIANAQKADAMLKRWTSLSKLA